MFSSYGYELIDYGEGRKLERFGGYLLDRAAPAAEFDKRERTAEWKQANARYERTEKQQGQWLPEGALPERWTVGFGPLTFEIKPTTFGHLGVFPEQAGNWEWIAQQCARAARPLRVLNLFAYTGGSTLAAAAAGAEVTHVDSAANVVDWAKRNAELSKLEDAPIRWLAEDARKYVRRELRRERRYDAIVLDPPSYGHGPKGEVWRLNRDLPRLLEGCAELAPEPAFFLLTWHTTGLTPKKLRQMLPERWTASNRLSINTGDLALRTSSDRELHSGRFIGAMNRSLFSG